MKETTLFPFLLPAPPQTVIEFEENTKLTGIILFHTDHGNDMFSIQQIEPLFLSLSQIVDIHKKKREENVSPKPIISNLDTGGMNDQHNSINCYDPNSI